MFALERRSQRHQTILENLMNFEPTEQSRIIAASPVVHEPGLLPHRIVIRDLGDEHVDHTEVLERGKKPWYHQGDYIAKRNGSETAEESDATALRKASVRFEVRVRHSMRLDTPPAKRLAEGTDIAQTIINTLLHAGKMTRRVERGRRDLRRPVRYSEVDVTRITLLHMAWRFDDGGVVGGDIRAGRAGEAGRNPCGHPAGALA
jgi:hypothetical protein